MLLTNQDPYVVVRIPPHDWERSANGGDYAFTYHFYLLPNGEEVEVEFGTSAEFDFCRVRGVFASCEDCPDWDQEERYCTAPPLVISREEALRWIDRLLEEVDRRRASS